MNLKEKIIRKLKRKTLLGSNLKVKVLNEYMCLFKKNDIKLCYNKHIPEVYDPKMKNILIAIESPAVIEDQGWLHDDMIFEAEISFANFYGLDNYICCRDLYSNNDNFFDLNLEASYSAKPKLLSLVCSDKKKLAGHKFRHDIIEEFPKAFDVYGSGYSKFGNIDEAFIDYKFQIVVENGKYPEYVSEKLFDCIKTKTIPLYWGGEEGLRKMGFDTSGMLFFDTKEDLSEIIKKLDNELYEKILPRVVTNLQRLVELRNENKLKFYLNTVMLGYMQTTDSYLSADFNHLNLLIDKPPQ